MFKKTVVLANEKDAKNEEFFCHTLKVLANEKKNVDSFTVSRENLFSEACQEVKQIRKKALHFTAAWGKLQWHEFYLPRKPKSF